MNLHKILLSPFLVFLLIIILLAGFVPPYIHRARNAILYPYQLDGEEGFILEQALSIARGESIYQPIAKYPFLAGNYPPLYPLGMSIISGGDAVLAHGRIISFICALGIMLLLVYCVATVTRNVVLSILAPLIFLITYDNYEWIAYCRVDYCAVFFSISGLAAALTGNMKRISLMLAGLAFFLALYAKHIQLAAAAAVILWLILENRRTALIFTASLAGAIIVTFLILMIFTNGEVYRHLIVYNANKFDFWQFSRLLLHFWRFNKYILLIAAILSILEIVRIIFPQFYQRTDSGAPYSLVTLYFAISMISLIGLAKEGAAPNYFIEPEAALALFVSIASYRHFSMLKRRRSAYGVVFIVIVFILAAGHVYNLNRMKPALFSHHNPGAADLGRAEQVRRLVQEHPGDILSEYPIFNIRCGRPVLFQPFIMSELVRQGIWDPAPLIEDLHKKRFALIITTNDLFENQFFFRWHPDILGVVRAAYAPYKQFTYGAGIHYFVYSPRSPAL